mmetsp:Transcript_11068/g.46176  ORF Transcript_11068/g.46176 Transcript_11068/m.46176 type:complete len:234 (+) Transcript_11068:4574-5275(+)
MAVGLTFFPRLLFSFMIFLCFFDSVNASQIRIVPSAAEVANVFASIGCQTAQDNGAMCPADRNKNLGLLSYRAVLFPSRGGRNVIARSDIWATALAAGRSLLKKAPPQVLDSELLAVVICSPTDDSSAVQKGKSQKQCDRNGNDLTPRLSSTLDIPTSRPSLGTQVDMRRRIDYLSYCSYREDTYHHVGRRESPVRLDHTFAQSWSHPQTGFSLLLVKTQLSGSEKSQTVPSK